MSSTDPKLHDEPAVETIALAGEHRLELALGRDRERDVIRLLTPDRTVGLAITITKQGISLQVTGADVSLATTGKLSLSAEELHLHGRSAVAITSEGDASMRVTGDLSTEARIQNIRARLGNVNVTANDDVKLVGERIKLNA